jgi:hypothetical protein
MIRWARRKRLYSTLKGLNKVRIMVWTTKTYIRRENFPWQTCPLLCAYCPASRLNFCSNMLSTAEKVWFCVWTCPSFRQFWADLKEWAPGILRFQSASWKNSHTAATAAATFVTFSKSAWRILWMMGLKNSTVRGHHEALKTCCSAPKDNFQSFLKWDRQWTYYKQ